MSEIRRVLSIDGGGIRGAIPAAFLASIEESTGERVVDHFDLIAGTSTGGIIALGLGLGMTAAEILGFYESDGPRIFAQVPTKSPLAGRLGSWIRRRAQGLRRTILPKYDPSELRRALEVAFGERRLHESRTRLVIPAFDRQRRKVHIFKTAHHPRFRVDWKERAVDVAMATAAAPTYLPGHRMDSGVSLLDGGIWAANPTGLAVVEAVSILGWSAQSLRVLSLGCSEEPIKVPEHAGVLGMALKMADVFLLGQSSGSMGTAKLLIGSEARDERLVRIQHSAAEGEFALDSVQQIPAMKGLGFSLAREALPRVRESFLFGHREAFEPLVPDPGTPSP